MEKKGGSFKTRVRMQTMRRGSLREAVGGSGGQGGELHGGKQKSGAGGQGGDVGLGQEVREECAGLWPERL